MECHACRKMHIAVSVLQGRANTKYDINNSVSFFRFFINNIIICQICNNESIDGVVIVMDNNVRRQLNRCENDTCSAKNIE